MTKHFMHSFFIKTLIKAAALLDKTFLLLNFSLKLNSVKPVKPILFTFRLENNAPFRHKQSSLTYDSEWNVSSAAPEMVYSICEMQTKSNDRSGPAL